MWNAQLQHAPPVRRKTDTARYNVPRTISSS
jgi:hypothetical protein